MPTGQRFTPVSVLAVNAFYLAISARKYIPWSVIISAFVHSCIFLSPHTSSSHILHSSNAHLASKPTLFMLYSDRPQVKLDVWTLSKHQFATSISVRKLSCMRSSAFVSPTADVVPMRISSNLMISVAVILLPILHLPFAVRAEPIGVTPLCVYLSQTHGRAVSLVGRSVLLRLVYAVPLALSAPYYLAPLRQLL